MDICIVKNPFALRMLYIILHKNTKVPNIKTLSHVFKGRSTSTQMQILKITHQGRIRQGENLFLWLDIPALEAGFSLYACSHHGDAKGG